MNQKEQVFLNSCQISLQQFSSKLKGFIYFVWTKGKKHIQSLKYQCSDESTPIKQVLTLSLKTYSLNGINQKRYTHFAILDGDGREIDSIKFDITQWKAQPTQKRLTLGQCNIRFKVKRKIALELENFHRHSRTQVQESSQQSDIQQTSYQKLQKKQQLSIKQELAKAKRQLEDFEYITSKLKNDRNFYIIENENLRNNLSQIHDDYGNQITNLKAHYETRIQLRESIYQEQIQQLIWTFNSNYEINRALVETLIHEKYDYETQINQLKQMHQNYIQKQQQNYESVIADLQQNKKQLEDELKDCLNRITEHQNRIAHLTSQLEEANGSYDQTKALLNKEIQVHGKDKEAYEQTIQQKNKITYQNMDEIQQLKIAISTKDFQLKQNQSSMQHYRTMIQDLQKTKIELERVNHQQENQKYNLTVEIERLKVTVEQQLNTIEFNRASIEQLKQQDKLKQQQYSAQYKSLQAIYKQKQAMLTNELKQEHQKSVQLNKQNFDLTTKIQKFQHEVLLLKQQENILKNDNQQALMLNEQLRQQMRQQTEAFGKQYREYNEQISTLMSENHLFEEENGMLKEQSAEVRRKYDMDMQSLKHEYNDLINHKTKLYEDEIDFLKKTRDVDMENFQRLKKQFEEEIKSLLDREHNENEALQKMFRDEMELKNQELVGLQENHRLMREAYEDLKLRLELVQQQKANLLDQIGGRRGGSRHEEQMSIEQIEQDSDQSQDEDSDESEQQSEDSSDHKKKKKKKTKKKKTKKEKEKPKKKQKGGKKSKKKKVSSSQSESEKSSEVDSEEESEDESQILSKMDEDSIEGRNLVNLANNIAESEKIIPHQQKVVVPPIQISPERTVQRISIPIPQQHQLKSNDKQEKSLKKSRRKEQMKSSRMEESSRQSEDRNKFKDKVKQLESEVKKLKKQIKELQRNETMYLGQIQQNEQQIKNLNKEMDDLVKKISKKDPKLARKISNDLQDKREEKSDSNKSKSDISMKMPPVPRKQLQNIKIQNQFLRRQVEEKNRSIQILETQKTTLAARIQNIEVAKVQVQKKLGIVGSDGVRKSGVGGEIEDGLKKSLSELQMKFLNEKEKAQEVKLQRNQLKFENEQLQNQAKRLKLKLDDVEDQMKKLQPSNTVKEMQKELQESSRRVLQVSKALNTTKLQKQTYEEQARLLKKRYADIIRVSQQAESKSANLQRQVQESRRKQNKSRRDFQELHDDIRKYKDHIKQLQTQMNSLNTSTTQSSYEKKKIIGEVAKLEDIITAKQLQIVKLTKQLQKIRNRIQQGEDIKIGKRNELLAEKQRLDGLLIKASKRIEQLQEQDRVLQQRIELLDRENRKNLDEKKQSYGEKLRFYVDEISNIKSIVEQYQTENSRLKVQNSQFYEHNEILKMSFEKLQIKYEQTVESEQRLIEELELTKKDLDQIHQDINQKNLQLEANHITITNLRKQLDIERNISKKKSDKINVYEQVNQKYIYQIKSLKIKLSEFETNVNQNQLLTEKCQASTRTIEELETQLKRLHQQYTQVVHTYTYRKEDVEQAMKQLKQHEQKVKQEEITRVIEELDSTYSTKQASMQQQIIELFNQNSKLRMGLQHKNDQNAENLITIAELQNLPDKVKHLQKQRDAYERAVYELGQQTKSLSEQLRRAESKVNQLIRSQQGKATENVIITKKYEDMQKKYKDQNQIYLQLKKQQKKLLQRFKINTEQKQKLIEKLTNDIQHYQNKILALQLEVNRLKDSEQTSTRDYTKKIKKLEQKIEEMTDTFKEREDTMEGHYIGEGKKMQESIRSLSEELERKMQRIEELNEALIIIQGENDDLVNQLTGARTQIAQEGQLYSNQINKLRNEFRTAEQIYDTNLRNLQEQMSALSKELTTLRYNRQSGSRLSGSGVTDDKNSKRYEEKMKIKDRKIEELNRQITIMEESINKLVKKETTTESVSQAQIQKLRMNLNLSQISLKQLRQKYQTDTANLTQNLKLVKNDLILQRNKYEQKELEGEEKQLEIESLNVQLSTIKELYRELQHQLEKRKTNLNTQIEEESQLQAQIRQKNLRITELNQKMEQILLQRNKLQGQLKRKSLQLKRVTQKLNEVQINYRQLFSGQEKKSAEIRQYKQLSKQFEQKHQKSVLEIKRLKGQSLLLSKQSQHLREELGLNRNQQGLYVRKIQQMSARLQQSQIQARRYKQLNEKLQRQEGMDLQGFTDVGYWRGKLNSKDQDIQILAQELERQRQILDEKCRELQQTKKGLFEVRIQAENAEFAYEQMMQLREMYVQLENDRNNAIFRQEAIKIQLQNLIQSENRSHITDKLQSILQHQYEE